MQVLRRFVQALAAGHGSAAGDAMDAGAGWWLSALRSLGCLQAGPSCAIPPSAPYPVPPLFCSAPADTDEATALQDFMLAALKSFVRRYNVQCAQLAERIGGEVLGAPGVPAELKAAVEAQLQL